MRQMNADDWARLYSLIDDDAEARDAVVMAASDPAAFLEAHAEVLGEIGITETAQIDPWLALIDGLDDAGALAYLDPDDDGEQLADALAGVPRVVRGGIDVDAIGDVSSGLDDAIAAADALLGGHALRLVFLDEGTDDVPLVVVPSGDADEIVALAARLGHTARVFD